MLEYYCERSNTLNCFVHVGLLWHYSVAGSWQHWWRQAMGLCHWGCSVVDRTAKAGLCSELWKYLTTMLIKHWLALQSEISIYTCTLAHSHTHTLTHSTVQSPQKARCCFIWLHINSPSWVCSQGHQKGRQGPLSLPHWRCSAWSKIIILLHTP